MPNCSRCQGEGEETYDEDDRRVTDVCYHCAGSGQVDEDTHFHDQLHSVAATLAYVQESDYRKAADSDLDGDGYNMGAYEDMMTPHDYFRTRVWNRTEDIGQALSEFSLSDQQLLIAWNNYEPS